MYRLTDDTRGGWKGVLFPWNAPPRLEEQLFTQGQIRDDRILDVGGGIMAASTCYGPNVFVIDPWVGKDGKAVLNPHRAVRGIAEELPFDSGMFRHAFSRCAVGYYPENIDLEKAIEEMLRVTRPDGTVRFDYTRSIGYENVCRIMETVEGFARRGYNTCTMNEWIFLSHPEKSLEDLDLFASYFEGISTQRYDDNADRILRGYVGKKVLIGRYLKEALFTAISDWGQARPRLRFLSFSQSPQHPETIFSSFFDPHDIMVVDAATKKLIYKGGDSVGGGSFADPGMGRLYHDYHARLTEQGIFPMFEYDKSEPRNFLMRHSQPQLQKAKNINTQ